MRKKMRKHLILPSALLIVLLLCGTVSASAEAAGAAGDGNAAEETAEATETAEESDGAETEAPAEEVQPDCSSWAVEEVREAIAEGLVPEHLQSGYQQPVTRGELAELTAYYVLWHEPEDTTMEEMWARMDEYYAQRRADESTMDPEYYRSYAENVFTYINEEFFNRMYQFHYISGYPDGSSGKILLKRYSGKGIKMPRKERISDNTGRQTAAATDGGSRKSYESTGK